MSIHLAANFDHEKGRGVFKTSWVPGGLSGERLGCPEGVLDLRRRVKKERPGREEPGQKGVLASRRPAGKEA